MVALGGAGQSGWKVSYDPQKREPQQVNEEDRSADGNDVVKGRK